jgi:putative transposase
MMKYDSKIHHRKSIRLKGYDYSQAGYCFVTAATLNMHCIFGEIIGGEMRLSKFGGIVKEEWLKSAEKRRDIELDQFVIMPNHIHGIIIIKRAQHAVPVREAFGRPVAGSLPTIMRAFKAAAAKKINELRGTPGKEVWHRNYFEHVIRDDEDLDRIREYILYNPARWDEDADNPNKIK